jgi:hypothetical protein
MRNLSPLSQITLALAIIASALIWAERPANRVFAIQDSEDKPSPLAIAFGQSLFLNVANVGSEDPIPIEMVIFDDSGNPLKRDRHLLRPGHTESFSLNRDDISGRAGSRVLVRAVVSSLGGPDTRNLVVSQEVVDNETQRTMILHPGISKGFNPQPDPPGIQR